MAKRHVLEEMLRTAGRLFLYIWSCPAVPSDWQEVIRAVKNDPILLGILEVRLQLKSYETNIELIVLRSLRGSTNREFQPSSG